MLFTDAEIAFVFTESADSTAIEPELDVNTGDSRPLSSIKVTPT